MTATSGRLALFSFLLAAPVYAAQSLFSWLQKARLLNVHRLHRDD